LANAKTGVHDFVFESGRDHAWLGGFRAFLIAHRHLDFGAQGLAVEFDGLFAIAVKKEIRLDDSII
jgi:hypothetical protein